jgi:DNA polymerase-3 subunit gamma/tau
VGAGRRGLLDPAMAYQVLARTWRPRRFAEVLGQEHVTRSLKNAIAGGRIAHAILLTGPRGVGKTTIARIFAKALCCEKGPAPEPCDACQPCREIAEGSAIDVQEIDGASNRGVENVRELRESVKYAPASARFKVYIIDEVHMLTMEAFNALLKTLEEPPDHVKFVFATTDVHKLPLTILSRVQRYDFSRIPTRAITGKLLEIVKAEAIDADEAALAGIARQSEGSMRDALTILDQLVAYTGGKVEEEAVREALGLIDRALLLDLVQAVIRAEPAACVATLRKLDAQGADEKRALHEILGLLRDLVVIRTVKDPSEVIEAPGTELDRLREIGGGIAPETLHALFDLFLEAEQEVDSASLPFLVLEMSVLKAAHLRPLIPVQDLVRRLTELESGGVPPGPAPQRSPRPAAGEPGQPPSSRRRSGAEAPPDGGGTGSAGPPAASPPRQSGAGREEPRGDVQPPEPPPIEDKDLHPGEDEVDGEAAAGPVDQPRPAWERYVTYVAGQAPLLGSVLSHARFAGITEEELRVSFDVALHADMLRGKAESAARLASECFGRPMRVVIVSSPGDKVRTGEEARRSRAANREKESDRERALKKEALDHDAVNQARQILGGEIKEIKTFGA